MADHTEPTCAHGRPLSQTECRKGVVRSEDRVAEPDPWEVLDSMLGYIPSHEYRGEDRSHNSPRDEAIAALTTLREQVERDKAIIEQLERDVDEWRMLEAASQAEWRRLGSKAERQEAAMVEARRIAEDANQFEQFADIFFVLDRALSPSSGDRPTDEGYVERGPDPQKVDPELHTLLTVGESEPERCPHPDNWFDRTLCFCVAEGVMHTRCTECGEPLDGGPGHTGEETPK